MIQQTITRLSVATLLVLFNLPAIAQQQSFRIEGKFSNWQNRGPVVLQYIQNNAVKADTAEVKNGKFLFKGKLDSPVRAAIYSIAAVQGQTKDNTSFYLDKGKVSLKGTDSLKTAIVLGSLLTREGKLLDEQTAPILKELLAIRLKAAELAKDEQHKEELNALNTPYKDFIDTLSKTKVQFIRTHPQSYLSVLTLSEYTGGAIDTDFVEPLWNGLSTPLKETPLAKDIANKVAVAKRVRIGATMPNFTSLDTLRQELSLQEVVKKGKVTLVDFWASWCAPCRKENPNIVKAYNTFHNKGFNILSISLDKSEDAWKKAINDDGMPWYHVSSLKFWDEPIAKSFGIHGVPWVKN